MAVTFTTSIVEKSSIGNEKRIVASLALSGTYATNGFSVTPSPFGLGLIQDIVFEEASGYLFNWDATNKKCKAFYPGKDVTPSGTNGNESSHTHAVALDGGATSSDSAGTPAGSVAAPTLTMDSYTPSGTNAVSAVNPYCDADSGMAVKPVIALTHNADPVGGLAASLLYNVEDSGYSLSNVGFLQSNCNGAASVLGETANGTIGGTAASARFWVTHNLTPAGVQIYVAEDTGDRLEFVSPTASDAFLVMPFEAAAGAPPGYAVTVKVYHDADAATGKALYFDDDGAADAQLVFVDTGAAGGVIPAADITVLGPAFLRLAAGGAGQAAAQ